MDDYLKSLGIDINKIKGYTKVPNFYWSLSRNKIVGQGDGDIFEVIKSIHSDRFILSSEFSVMLCTSNYKINNKVINDINTSNGVIIYRYDDNINKGLLRCYILP